VGGSEGGKGEETRREGGERVVKGWEVRVLVRGGKREE